MNRGALFVLWVVIAWTVPAAIAGGLGWKGIWGTGSAFGDYLIPIPVAGGVFHVPSLVLVSLVLFTQPWQGRPGGWARGILLAGALVGLVTLLDLDKLQLAAATDAAGGSFWQRQPLGLFILTDCVVAQFFVGALNGRWPAGAKEWSASLLIALAVPGLYAAAALKADPRQQNPFVFTGSRNGAVRGDELAFYYSKLPTASVEFRQAAAAVLPHHDPRMNMNSEDIAIYFFDSLAAAQSQREGDAGYTACLYQDGTPTSWVPGSFDCFADHESFSERFAKAYDAQDRGLPQDVRSHLARRDACMGRKPLASVPGAHMDNMEVRSCDPQQTEQRRESLLKQFEGDERVIDALK